MSKCNNCIHRYVCNLKCAYEDNDRECFDFDEERPKGEYTEEDMKQAIKENFDIGYEMAKNKYARPQGKLACEVWKLYEKHHSHLATHVIEFGDELKDLLGKYLKGGAEE